MPEIKTILASRGIDTGSTGPSADPSSFGNGRDLMGLARGMEQFGEGSGHMLSAVQELHKKINDLDERRWVLEQANQFNSDSAEFMYDPKKRGSDTFANDYKVFYDDRLAKAKASSPSPEATNLLVSHLGSIGERDYQNALHTTFVNKIHRGAVALSDNLNATVAYASNMAAQGGPKDALAQSVQDNLDSAFKTLDSDVAGVLPELAQKAKEQMTHQAISGVAQFSTDEARAMLGRNTTLTGDQRASLERHIQLMEDQSQRRLIPLLKDDEQQTLFAAMNGAFGKDKMQFGGESSPEKVFSLEHYRQAYKDPQIAEREHRQFWDSFNAANTAYDTYYDIRGLRPEAQNEALAKIQPLFDSKEASHARTLLEHMVRTNQTLLKEDPKTWMLTNNPIVRSTYEALTQAASSGDVQATGRLRHQLNDQLMQYQGSAPDGGDPAVSSQYMGRGDYALLTKKESQDIADRINTTPDQAFREFKILASLYPDPRHFNVVMGDLAKVRGEKAINGSYRWIAANLNEPWITSYIKSLQEFKPDEASMGEKLKTMVPKVDKAMADYQAAMSDRIPDYDNLRHGVVAFAAQKMAAGATEQAAIEKSVEQLLGSRFSIQTVNGSKTIFPRSVGEKVFTDDEIQKLPRNLEGYLSRLDVNEIDWSRADPVMVMSIKNPSEFERLAKGNIKANARFRLSNDGTQLQLMMNQPAGVPFMLLDRSGKPFTIDLKQEAHSPALYINYGWNVPQPMLKSHWPMKADVPEDRIDPLLQLPGS